MSFLLFSRHNVQELPIIVLSSKVKAFSCRFLSGRLGVSKKLRLYRIMVLNLFWPMHYVRMSFPTFPRLSDSKGAFQIMHTENLHSFPYIQHIYNKKWIILITRIHLHSWCAPKTSKRPHGGEIAPGWELLL